MLVEYGSPHDTERTQEEEFCHAAWREDFSYMAYASIGEHHQTERCGILTYMAMNDSIFWDLRPRSVVEIYRSFWSSASLLNVVQLLLD
jgi:hypothetical protein